MRVKEERKRERSFSGIDNEREKDEVNEEKEIGRVTYRQTITHEKTKKKTKTPE